VKHCGPKTASRHRDANPKILEVAAHSATINSVILHEILVLMVDNVVLKFLFWNVQHGSAAFVSTPNRRSIVVDLGTGTDSKGNNFSPLGVLRANGLLDAIDLLILTHPHEDHLSDIGALSGIPIRKLIAPAVPMELLEIDSREPNQTVVRQYSALVSSHNYRMPFNLGGDRDIDYGDVSVTHFIPAVEGTNLNDFSVVTLFEYAGAKLLMTGDNEEPSWSCLLNDKAFTRAIRGVDILVAPHHGRSSGFYAGLFEVIHPKLIVVSDGPCQDTSVTDQYTSVASGMTIHAGTSSTKRKCVTTRCDGNILVKIESGFVFPTIRVEVECEFDETTPKRRRI
jgi:competence protein ComEC